jgi:1-acyl-sn-glycerol-3-phosphate acyltransferase
MAARRTGSDGAERRDGNVVPLRPRPGERRHPSAQPAADAAEQAALYRLPGRPDDPPALQAPSARPARWEQRAADALGFVRKRLTGEYEVDEYGYDRELTEQVALPAFRALYEKWFRAEVNGIDNVPSKSGALLVANHAGGLWALDAAMTAVAVRLEHPDHRTLRMLGGELLFRTPGLGVLARRAGATLACTADAERLLRAGELVGTWPEGYRGIGKPFRERYQLQNFGRGGFVRTAVAAGAPIVPVSVVGAEEIHPVLGNAKTVARLLNLPYFPLTPTFPWLGPLGLVPLPSKWYFEFGTPVPTDGIDPDDPGAVTELADLVRDSIQSTLYRLLIQRRSVWR